MVYSILIITASYIIKRSIPCRKLSKILTRKFWDGRCSELVGYIKKIIISPEFVSRHRSNIAAFTRNRKLPFHLLVAFLTNFVHGSYQDELDKFFKTLFRFDIAKRIVSKAAFSKARMKLKFEAYVELNAHLVSFFEKHFKPRTWLGFRLLGIDSLTCRLPMAEDIAGHFGVWNCRQGAPSPMARVSQMFDVLNKITVDAVIKPKHLGERELASHHMLNVMQKDLLLLDRGYSAWWLFNLILSMEADFCARISCTHWKAVRKLYRSGLSEKIVRLPVMATSIARCRDMGLDLDPLELRLVRIENNGKTQVLITSLTDTRKYPLELFSDLYHCRWPVEEDYKEIKCRLELENFTGKSSLSVYQDFHAKVFLKNLVHVLALPVQDLIDADCQDRKYSYQINFTQALSKSKGAVALLLYESGRQIKRLIADLQAIFQRTLEPIRPGRKFPRKHKNRQRKYFVQYKPIG